MKTRAEFDAPQQRRAKQGRYNPISGLTDPRQVARKLDAFEAGYLREAVNIWETLEQRDDLIRTVVSKRKKAIGREGWTVLAKNDLRPEQAVEAREHVAALEYFYNHLECENALDSAEKGGFKLLVRQMMDAVGKRFAVHEIVWSEPDRPQSAKAEVRSANSKESTGGRGQGNIQQEGTEGTGREAFAQMTNVQALMSKEIPRAKIQNEGRDFSHAKSAETAKGELGKGSRGQGTVISREGEPIHLKNEGTRAWRRALTNGAPVLPMPNAGSAIPRDRQYVTAKFRFVPLSFFENTTGRLRFLETESETGGRELEAGAWMVSVGEGLMMATSMAWILKSLALNDWLQYSERNGRPGLKGATASAEGSDEWNALDRALGDLLNGSAVVHNSNDEIKVVDLAAGGEIPFPTLVERMDRMMAALWRGADLSTISRDRGYGASLQEKETCALEEDDAEMLTETLNRYVDEWVIKYVFGEEVKPLAQVKVLVSPRECTTADIQIDEFLIRNGAPLSIQETMSRYGRALPKEGEATLGRKMSNDQALVTKKNGHLSHAEGAEARREEDLQASYPESSSHRSEGSEMVMKNEEASWGPAVTFRDSSLAEGMTNDQALMTRECTSTNSTIPNEFAVIQPDWLQLSPYGEFPHSRGLQRVDRAAVDVLVAQFNSFRGRLGRLFGGVPFYIGHPDVPNASDLADRKAYGWVNQLEAREDGLYGLVKWSDAGLDLLKNAYFKYLSPYWEAREIGNQNGRRVYQPVALVSVGLTNQPNIPVRPLANEQKVQQEETERTEENLEKKATKETKGEKEPSGRNPAEQLEFAFVQGSSGTSRGDETQTLPRSERAENHQSLLTSTATPVRKMHCESLTNNLGSRRGELVLMYNRRDRIQEAVLAKTRLGMSYDEAWESVKREHSAWFE